VRGTALLVLAGIAAFAAALRFETAVHPGEISAPDSAAAFARAADLLPALASVRIHADDPGLGARLRRLDVAGGIGRIVEVAAVERSLARGSLAAWDADRLARFEERLRAGELPDEFPPVPDARAYFRDERGAFDYEVFLRPGIDVARIRNAAPGATLLGEPVVRADEEQQRRPLARATIAALLAVAAGSLLLRLRSSRDAGWERRLVAMTVPLALLGWTGKGIDVWTVSAVVLAGTARSGFALLPGWALLLSPVLALQRIGIVLGLASLLRLPAGWWRLRPSVPGRRWGVLASLAGIGIAMRFALVPVDAAPQAAGLEPVAAFVPEQERGARAEAWSARTMVVGGERFPDARADREARRRLTRIFDLATSRAGATAGREQAVWERVAAAAARDAIEIPRGLRDRRETTDGRAVLWLADRLDAAQQSYRHYRADSRGVLERGALVFAWLLFALGAALRTARGGVGWREVVAPLLALAVATVMLTRHDLGAALPLFAVAVFCAGWMTPIGLAFAALFLPIDFWAAVAAFAMASAAAAAGLPNRR